jgi:hypothetical protein
MQSFKSFHILLEDAESKAKKLADKLKLDPHSELIMSYKTLDTRNKLEGTDKDIGTIKTEDELKKLLDKEPYKNALSDISNKGKIQANKEAVKSVSEKDNYDLIEETDEWKVIEPRTNPCTYIWSPKRNDGEGAWCIGWRAHPQYFENYKRDYGARYFLMIDKKENPDQAKYAFVPMEDVEESQWRDYRNDRDLPKKTIRAILDTLPKTRALIVEVLGSEGFLKYDEISEFDKYGIADAKLGEQRLCVDRDGNEDITILTKRILKKFQSPDPTHFILSKNKKEITIKEPLVYRTMHKSLRGETPHYYTLSSYFDDGYRDSTDIEWACKLIEGIEMLEQGDSGYDSVSNILNYLSVSPENAESIHNYAAMKYDKEEYDDMDIEELADKLEEDEDDSSLSDAIKRAYEYASQTALEDDYHKEIKNFLEESFGGKVTFEEDGACISVSISVENRPYVFFKMLRSDTIGNAMDAYVQIELLENPEYEQNGNEKLPNNLNLDKVYGSVENSEFNEMLDEQLYEVGIKKATPKVIAPPPKKVKKKKATTKKKTK